MIVAGSRSFNDYRKLTEVLDEFHSKHKITEIVSGCATGADRLGEWWADSRSVSLKLFPANWEKFGKRAGFIRNEEMAEYADCLVLFWDGISRGSKDMRGRAISHNLKIKIVYF